VSSGAIAAGRGELGWKHKPTGMGEKQAAAAVGQVRLMERYRSCFQKKSTNKNRTRLSCYWFYFTSFAYVFCYLF
jgi:glutamate 5-kinase